MADPHKLDIGKELVKGLQVHVNIRQEMLITTADRVRLCLINTRGELISRTAWIAPLGIFLATMISLVTSDFRDIIGITKTQWHDIFIGIISVSGVWLLLSLWKAIKSLWNYRMADPIEQIVTMLKAEAGVTVTGSVEPTVQPHGETFSVDNLHPELGNQAIEDR